MTLRDIIDLVLDFKLIYLIFVFTVPLFAYLGFAIFKPLPAKMNPKNPFIATIKTIKMLQKY